MKKHYDLTLDEEKTEELKIILKANGQTLSGFLSSMVENYVDTMNGFKKSAGIPDDVSNFSVRDFAKLFISIMAKFAEDKKKPAV
jgi:predicted DNA-binding protein